LYLLLYIRTLLESLRLQVESPVLGTAIHILLVYLVGWEPSNVALLHTSGLKTPIEVYLESCPLASVTATLLKRPRSRETETGCLRLRSRETGKIKMRLFTEHCFPAPN
jgi:hypothetical protein